MQGIGSFAALMGHRGTLHDPASGLPGPAIFIDRLEYTRTRGGRHSDPFVVAFMDVQASGSDDAARSARHAEAGLQLAERVRAPLRAADTVAAIGPLQFGLLFEGVPNLAAAYAVLTRLLQDVSLPLGPGLASGQTFVPEGRCGAAVATEPLSADSEVAMRAWAAFARAREMPSPALAIFDFDRDGEALAELRRTNSTASVSRRAS